MFETGIEDSLQRLKHAAETAYNKQHVS